MAHRTDRYAAARAARSARRLERIEEFRRLTRDEAHTIGVACARMHISKSTASDYEKELIAATGMDALTARRRLYWQTRKAGVSKPDAAAWFRITYRTASNWERVMLEANRAS